MNVNMICKILEGNGILVQIPSHGVGTKTNQNELEVRNIWVIDEKKKQVLIIYYMTH